MRVIVETRTGGFVGGGGKLRFMDIAVCSAACSVSGRGSLHGSLWGYVLRLAALLGVVVLRFDVGIPAAVCGGSHLQA